jgi:hypothetical protein
MMEVIFSSFVTLKDILIILVFFFTVAAIIGQQIFNGLFKNRCVDLSTGICFNEMESFENYKLCNPLNECDDNPDTGGK